MRQDNKLVFEFIPESSISFLNIWIDANRWWDLPVSVRVRNVPKPPTKKKQMRTASSVLVELGRSSSSVGGGSVGVTPWLTGSSGSAWCLEAKRLLRVAQWSAASSGWWVGWCPLSAAPGTPKTQSQPALWHTKTAHEPFWTQLYNLFIVGGYFLNLYKYLTWYLRIIFKKVPIINTRWCTYFKLTLNYENMSPLLLLESQRGDYLLSPVIERRPPLSCWFCRHSSFSSGPSRLVVLLVWSFSWSSLEQQSQWSKQTFNMSEIRIYGGCSFCQLTFVWYNISIHTVNYLLSIKISK